MTDAQPDGAPRRLLLVHAHPDDETIGTGATMARYAAEGVDVTLVTCTLGEEGEVLVPALGQLAADAADQLGGWRIAELRSAMAELGAIDVKFLGGAGHYRDSGMMGSPANGKGRAFWRADSDRTVFEAAAAELVAVIRQVRPQVVVTYDDVGGYGHPDHIMAHRVTTAALPAAADAGYQPPAGYRLSSGSAADSDINSGTDSGTDSVAAFPAAPWQVSKFYWTAIPRSVMAAELAAVRAAGDAVPFDAVTSDPPFVVADELVTTAVHCPEFGAAKARAMAAHATQITVSGPFYALSNNLGRLVGSSEYFRLISGELGERGPDGHENDLFAGLTLESPAAAQ